MKVEDLTGKGQTGKVTVKEVLWFDTEESYGFNNVPSAVVVYKIENNDDNLLFGDFYIATFDDGANERVWGVGDTADDALEDAERNWDRMIEKYGCDEEEGECNNPFREALEKLKEMYNQNPSLMRNYL